MSGRHKPKPAPDDGSAQHNKTNISGSVDIRGIVQTEIDPSLREKQDATERKKDTRDERRLAVEIITLIALIIYAIFTYGIYRANNKAADAALSAADTARDTLIASNRPWLDITVVPIGGFSFTDIGANIPFALKVTNVGHSPAIRVSGGGTLYFPLKDAHIMTDVLDADEQLTKICANAIPANNNWSPTQTVIPGTDGTVIEQSPGVTYEAINRGGYTRYGFLRPYILACIAYQSTVEPPTVWHTTRVRYVVTDKGKAGQPMAILMNQDVPQERIELKERFIIAN